MVVKVSQGNFETIFYDSKAERDHRPPPEKKSETAATAQRSGSLKTPECGGVADVADVFEGEDGREGRWGRRCAGAGGVRRRDPGVPRGSPVAPMQRRCGGGEGQVLSPRPRSPYGRSQAPPACRRLA